MSYILMDFETRSKVDIKDCGGWEYSKRAEMLCLAYSLDGGKTVKIWRRFDLPPYDLFNAIEAGWPIHAHNAAFEIAIWKHVAVAKHNWPPIPDELWRCTMAEGLAVGLPGSLEKASEALKLDVKKDLGGRRLMLQLAKPRAPSKTDKRLWFTQAEKFNRLYDYCIQDVATEAAIHVVIPRLSSLELSVWQYDQKVNQRGVRIDRELAEEALQVWDLHTKNLNKELLKITGGEVVSANATDQLKSYLNRNGVLIDNVQKDTVVDALKTAKGTAKRVLEIRQELSLASIAKYQKMIHCMSEDDDRIRGVLQYHGAQTGRYAGRLIQIQNFPRGGLKEKQIERLVELVKTKDLDQLYAEPRSLGDTLSGLLRSAIIPEEGKKFIVCDFAAIEARGLAWAARETWLLDAFRAGKDVYVEMAANHIYNIPADEVTASQRFFGKQAILGSGYGMGAEKFFTLLTDTYKVDTTKEFAKEVITIYRDANPNIVRFWGAIDRAAIRCVKEETDQRCGPVVFRMDGRWLKMRLPSGRDISYLDPKIGEGRFGGDQIEYTGTDFTGRVCENSTYGGKLTENAIQAICRDLLVYSMAMLEKRGYTVVAHIHDEVILEVDEDFGSLEEVQEIMGQTPKWAKDLPVAAEGFVGYRYRK